MHELLTKFGRDATVITIGTVLMSLGLDNLEHLTGNPEGFGVPAEVAPVVSAVALLVWRKFRPAS